jgi:hypothetical protein
MYIESDGFCSPAMILSAISESIRSFQHRLSIAYLIPGTWYRYFARIKDQGFEANGSDMLVVFEICVQVTNDRFIVPVMNKER